MTANNNNFRPYTPPGIGWLFGLIALFLAIGLFFGLAVPVEFILVLLALAVIL